MASEQQAELPTGGNTEPIALLAEATHPHQTSAQRPSPLFTLSAELRNRIYRMVLCEHEVIEDSKGTIPPTPGLLQTGRQIRQEAMGIYAYEVFFYVSVRDYDCTIPRYIRDILPTNVSTASVSQSLGIAHESQASWPNLIEWLEAFHEDKALGITGLYEELNLYVGPQAVVNRLVELMFVIVGTHKEVPWTTLESILSTFQIVLEIQDPDWRLEGDV